MQELHQVPKDSEEDTQYRPHGDHIYVCGAFLHGGVRYMRVLIGGNWSHSSTQGFIIWTSTVRCFFPLFGQSTRYVMGDTFPRTEYSPCKWSPSLSALLPVRRKKQTFVTSLQISFRCLGIMLSWLHIFFSLGLSLCRHRSHSLCRFIICWSHLVVSFGVFYIQGPCTCFP